LIEVVVGSFIAGTVVVGSVVIMGTAVRSTDVTSGNVELLQLIQTQIEMIQHAPYDEFGVYPLLTNLPGVELPEGVTLSITTEDTGTNYRFPGGTGSPIVNIVQRVDVTLGGTAAEKTLSFYKITEP